MVTHLRRLSLVVTFLLLTVLMVTPASAQGFVNGETIRMLVVGDPLALALNAALEELEDLSGGSIEIEVVGYTDTYDLTLLNARDAESSYDIVSFDAVWVGEYGTDGVLLPLNDLVAASSVVNPSDFLEIAYEGAQFDGAQLGLPIQPHPELLWYRADLFEAAGIDAPVTTDDLLADAEALTDVENNQYGVCWNGQRGQALGQQMAQFYAAFGAPLLDENGQPNLNTPQALEAAEYALALLPFSPPDVLNMAWDQRPVRFGQGGCAMTYEWAARTYLVEDDPTSQVAGLVGYTAAPSAPDVDAVTPIGSWNLGIPANIGERQAVAWQFLEWLTSSETQLLLAENGNGGMPRYSELHNEALQELYPAFAAVDALGTAGVLNDWMRPAVPQWSQLADILGNVYHDMLTGLLTPEEAAAEAQSQAEALFAS
jgi:multiple sugar transport system substrate-binding protein